MVQILKKVYGEDNSQFSVVSWNERWISVCYYAMSFLPIPPLNIILTILFWKVVKRKSFYIDSHGRQAINMQVSFQLYALVLSLFSFMCNWIGRILTGNTSFRIELLGYQIGYILFIVMGVFFMILLVYAFLRALAGNRVKIPFTIALIKERGAK